MNRRRFLLAQAAAFASLPGPSYSQSAERKKVRVYFMGNSVTDTLRYPELAKLAATRGIDMPWGRHMVPGAPLEWLWTHPSEGFQQEPFGHYQKALTEFAWDILSLQPFDRHLHNKNKEEEDLGDVPLILRLAEMAAKKNPDVQVFLYARWPRITAQGKGIPFDKNDYDPAKPGSGADLSQVDDFLARWNASYTGGWDNTNESRDYFDQLLAAVQKEATFLKKPPRLVPVGHVMAAMHEEMKAGRVPGYTSIWQFYKDGIHLNEPGSYLVACTFFAAFFGESPLGLPHESYGKFAAALARKIQETVAAATIVK